MSLKHAILGFLTYMDLSGYDLKKALDSSVEHFWHADQSQIYRTLRKLKEEGLVTQEVQEREDRLDRKVYSATEDGKAELMQWLTTPHPLPDEHDPFLIQVYFGGMMSKEEFLTIIRAQLANAEEQAAIFNAINEMAQVSFAQNPDKWMAFCAMSTLEHGAYAVKYTRQWLTSIIERVENDDLTPQDIAEILSVENH